MKAAFCKRPEPLIIYPGVMVLLMVATTWIVCESLCTNIAITERRHARDAYICRKRRMPL
jgi:hypothetical protein